MDNNEELDIVELETEDGGTLKLCVEKYFFYNGDEFVLLREVEGEDPARFVMKVEQSEEDGEEMEDFVPVDEKLEEQLINVVKNTFSDDDEEDEEDDDAQ